MEPHANGNGPTPNADHIPVDPTNTPGPPGTPEYSQRLERVESAHAFSQHEQEGLSRELFRVAGLLERLGARVDQLEARLNAQAANADMGSDETPARSFEDERPPHAAGPMPDRE